MTRDPNLLVNDLLEAIEKIERYAEDITLEYLKSDDRTMDAIIKNFIIIGEASKQIPPEVKSTAPQIPWKEMSGVRDKLVHGYFEIKSDVIWETIKTRLPEVERLLRELLKSLAQK
jgi:uncharacterized protein with HEPN domain